MKIIDAHAHLWLNVDTVVNGSAIHPLEPNRSRSIFFGEERQMLPPYMTDGQNTAERFLSNMDYAQVSAAVITQEFIDGLQNTYLMQVQQRYPNRFFCFGMPAGLPHKGSDPLCDEAKTLIDNGFRGIKIPAARLPQQFLDDEMMQMLRMMEQKGIILGIELQDGDAQVSQMEEIIQECPRLKVAIGHFGMVTRPLDVTNQVGTPRECLRREWWHHVALQRRVLPLPIGNKSHQGGCRRGGHGETDVGFGLSAYHHGYHV